MAPLSKTLFVLTLAATALASNPHEQLHKRQVVTGTGTDGASFPSATPGAPFPFSNGTSPDYPTGSSAGSGSSPFQTDIPGGPGNGGGSGGSGNGGGPGGDCSAVVTMTVSETYTVTETAPSTGETSAAGPVGPGGPPYPTDGSGGIGGSPTATGTASGGAPSASIGLTKRYQMRGLEKPKKENKAWF